MNNTLEKTAQQLAGLRQSIAAIDASEAKIKGAARKHLTAVQKRLEKLRLKVLLDPAAAEEYQDLVLERGQLQRLA